MNRYMKLHDKVLSDRTVHHEPWKTVTLGTYRKSKEYLAALQTAPFNLGGLWMVEMISQMPISREKVEVNLAIASLRQLGFIWRDRPLSDDILAAARERGMDLCPAEVGPALRLSCRGMLACCDSSFEYKGIPVAMEPIRFRYWVRGQRFWERGVFTLGARPSGDGTLWLSNAQQWTPDIVREHDRPIIFRISDSFSTGSSGANAKGGRKLSLWKKLFGSKEAAGAQPAAVRPKRSQEACLALYVFNSNKISDEVSAAYGAYAQGEVLKALSKALKPDGGWTVLPSLVQACDGDLFEHSMRGETPAVTVFGNWLRARKYGLDARNLESTVMGKFKSGQSLGYIPYVVGIGTVQKSHALRTHQELKARSIAGYMGLVTLDEAPFLVNVASELYLPLDMMEIRGSKCSGWLAGNEAIQEAGLER